MAYGGGATFYQGANIISNSLTGIATGTNPYSDTFNNAQSAYDLITSTGDHRYSLAAKTAGTEIKLISGSDIPLAVSGKSDLFKRVLADGSETNTAVRIGFDNEWSLGVDLIQEVDFANKFSTGPVEVKGGLRTNIFDTNPSTRGALNAKYSFKLFGVNVSVGAEGRY